MPKLLNETKHYRAAAQIRQLANTLPPGESLPVASELTRRLGISHGTAIRALKVLSDDGVIYRPLGKQRYRIAERFERASARISMVRPDFSSGDLDAITQSVYEAGQKRNWKFNQYCFRSGRELDFCRVIGECDAMVLIPPAEYLTDEFVKLLLKPARPVAVLLQHLRHPQINNVCTNDFRVGELAAETLYEHGHRRILFLKDQPDETTMRERRRGFQSAADRLRIPAGDKLYFDSHPHVFEDPLEATYQGLFRLLRSGKADFTAIFSASLVGGMAALRAAHELGLKVPEQLAVLCFSGESNLAPYFQPPLSCIETDRTKFGEYTAELLTAALTGANGKMPQQLKIEPKLIMRSSI